MTKICLIIIKEGYKIMESTINKLTNHNDYFKISIKSRIIRKCSASTQSSLSNKLSSIYNSNSLTVNRIEYTRKKYSANSSLKPTNMIVINLMHDTIHGTDEGIFISRPVKEINQNTLINDISAVGSAHGNYDYEITIDKFYLSTIAEVITYYKSTSTSQMKFVLTNQGLIIVIMDDSDLAKYLLKNNNGKIQIILYYTQYDISIEDSSLETYRKIPISVNNSKKISQFFSSYFRYKNLEIAKYFIKKYPNSYIYDFVNGDYFHLINLSYIECLSDSGTKVHQNNKTVQNECIQCDNI